MSQRLSETLPPLIFGTATLNYQFNPDPYLLSPNELVSAALKSGIRAFDTSPYYGPSEIILSDALHSTPSLPPRSDYFLLTKCGRITSNEFDYSPSWITFSVQRSLRRLRTSYLDVVYLHDVEFVSPAEVLQGVRALREIRDTTKSIHYIGICGYPVIILASLADMILRETGEPVDIIQSYANYTLQNQTLSHFTSQFKQAGVDVVVNASPLGMGLLRQTGVPVGSMGDWHPAPNPLRQKCLEAATLTHSQGEKLETVALRWTLDQWRYTGQDLGTGVPETKRQGVSCIGVSTTAELAEVMRIYDSLPAVESNNSTGAIQSKLDSLANQVRTEVFAGKWADICWDSPDKGFVNARTQSGVSQLDVEKERKEASEQKKLT